MKKTTVYLPDALKIRLERVAEQERCSEADLIRAAIDHYTTEHVRARPKLPLFDSGKGGLAEKVDEALRGFGED